MYRPQFPFPAAPPGFSWQSCAYQFDATNLPALGNLVLAKGQETGYIPLQLDHDAAFVLLGIKVSPAPVNILLFDPWSNQLMDDYVDPVLFADPLHLTILEGPGIEVPEGAVFSVRLQGQ